MKIFISLPMKGLSNGEIKSRILFSKNLIKDLFYPNKDIEFIDNFITEDPPENYKSESGYFLAKALDKIATSDAVYFANGWEDAGGCKLEHHFCMHCNIPTFYEKDAIALSQIKKLS